MGNHAHLVPFLKWAGGKRQLLPELRRYIPKSFGTYFEPFLGAGAVFFDLQPKNPAVVNDANAELMNAYRVIREDVEALIADLSRHQNDRDYYYHLRDLDRTDRFRTLSAVEQASRMIFLNKTCFNGLYRVNSRGYFNVPFGYYKNPKIVEADALRSIHQYLRRNPITLLNEDFEVTLVLAQRDDFIYLDPPYDPISNTASFTGYHLKGFNRDEQIRLKAVFDDLTRRGCSVLLSNSATKFICELYQEYRIDIIAATRAINSDGTKRGKTEEVLIMNYDPAIDSRLAESWRNDSPVLSPFHQQDRS